MLSCPFLLRLPAGTIRSRPWSTLRFAQKCPVMGPLVAKALGTAAGVPAPEDPAAVDAARRCPFVVNHLSQQELQPGQKVEVPERCPYHRVLAASGRPPRVTVCCQEAGGEFDYKAACAEQVERKKRDNSYRVFRKINRRGAQFPLAEEHTAGVKEVTVWCSNDYLGMSWHPLVQEAAVAAAKSHGVGSGGTRNISGNTIHHEALEAELADWHRKPSALLFTSCFVANEAALYTLGQLLPEVQFFSDAGNHASMIHGIRTSGRRKTVWPHNDHRELLRQLLALPAAAPKIVAFETVHSMTGDICPLGEILDVAKNRGALTFVDEVHAVGLYGDSGSGVAERDGRIGDIDLLSGTLGKAIGNIGGYVAGDADVVDAVRSYAGGFIFTTSLPPPVLAGARASLALLRSDEGRDLRRRHREAVGRLRGALIGNGVPAIDASSHIIPVHVGDPLKAQRISERMLRRHGAYIQAINYPTVARGDERLRLAPTPHHTPEMIDRLADQLAEAFRDECPQLLRGVAAAADAATADA